MTTKTQKFSFEFFPTKTDAGAAKLLNTAQRFADLGPEFFSVTYGAGGSTRDRTISTVFGIAEQTKISTAPHLSCVGDSKAQIADLLDQYKANGVNRIVALRGDLPSGMGLAASELRYANDLVEFIREHSGDHFKLEVAAYPEMHPQASNIEVDMQNFKRKMDAGADQAITQYFFNADCYFRFVERCQAMGIDKPIVPGIMPITNYTNLARFSDGCGTEIPRWIRKQLEAYGDDIASIQAFGEEVITNMCERLLDNGVPGLHFYTLNQADPCLALWNNLKLSDR